VAEPQKKKGLLGGNLFPKILILLAVGIIISVVLFGIPLTIPDLVWTAIRIVFGIGILVFAIKIMEKVLAPKKTDFSPTQSWRTKLIRAAKISRPPRTRTLKMRGEDGHIYYTFGRIRGLLFLPNWAGVPIINKATGKFLYVHKHDKEGHPMFDAEGKPVMMHDLTNITDKDGDWLFVITRGGLFASKEDKKEILVRANRILCSDIGEEVWIRTVNIVPCGEYFYPNQQWQADITRINMQHLAETIEETHMHFLDLAATTTESSLRSDPIFVKMMQSNTENIASKETAPIQDLGKRG